MEPRTPKILATHWIEKWNSKEVPAIGEEVGESELDWKLPRNDPELCLESIVEVLSRIPAEPSNKHFQVLAAGPLEDLILENGEKVIDQIDLLCRRSPEFRLLLNGTWISNAPPKVLARLEKYMGLKW